MRIAYTYFCYFSIVGDHTNPRQGLFIEGRKVPVREKEGILKITDMVGGREGVVWWLQR